MKKIVMSVELIKQTFAMRGDGVQLARFAGIAVAQAVNADGMPGQKSAPFHVFVEFEDWDGRSGVLTCIQREDDVDEAERDEERVVDRQADDLPEMRTDVGDGSNG